jgi:hypothetical protein
MEVLVAQPGPAVGMVQAQAAGEKADTATTAGKAALGITAGVVAAGAVAQVAMAAHRSVSRWSLGQQSVGRDWSITKAIREQLVVSAMVPPALRARTAAIPVSPVRSD